MDLNDCSEDSQEFVMYKQEDLFGHSFPIMKEIRRMGKLCDVTLKVGIIALCWLAFCLE